MGVMASKLSVKLVGSHENKDDVVLDDLRGFCAALTKCLRCVEEKFEGKTQLQFLVVGMRHGSCGLTIKPSGRETDTHYGSEVLALFNHTIRSLESGREIDRRFNSHDLKQFKRLTTPFSQSVRVIKFGRFELTNRFASNIDKLLEAPVIAQGEATGVLEKLDVHSRQMFTIFPIIGEPIECKFEDALMSQVKESIKKHVTVYGRMYYFLGSTFPGKAKITKIDIHPDEADLPSIMDLAGVLIGTDDRSAAEIVRAIRNEN